jgi:hypothetical protein
MPDPKRGQHMKTLIASAALLTLSAALSVAAAQTGNAPFCLKTTTGLLNCSFPSLAQCEQARGSSSGQCMTRSDAGGTTGLGDKPVDAPQSPGGQQPSPAR